MAQVLELADLRIRGTTALFEGNKHGDVDVSLFVAGTLPGSGPPLHLHPYAEVFVVQEGEATFTAGDEEIVVTGGHIVVVPAETPHRFVNTGEVPLRMVTVHPSGEVKQTDL